MSLRLSCQQTESQLCKVLIQFMQLFVQEEFGLWKVNMLRGAEYLCCPELCSSKRPPNSSIVSQGSEIHKFMSVRFGISTWIAQQEIISKTTALQIQLKLTLSQKCALPCAIFSGHGRVNVKRLHTVGH